MKTTTVRVGIDAHTQAKTAASARRMQLQDMATTALRFWFPLVSAARDVIDEIGAAAVEGAIAVEQFDAAVRALKEVLQEIDSEAS